MTALAADLAPPPPLTALDGSTLSESHISGRVVLVVNVASRCGYTRQYAGLQALHEEFSEDGLTILGVPCDQFGNQEPGDAQEIQTFCERNYGVRFPMLEKQAVNGPDRSPLYAQLVQSSVGNNDDIRWNFEKFLVGRDGTVIARFPSQVGPEAPELRQAIQTALQAP